MSKDTFLGWLRTAMTIAGSILIGKVIVGHALTTDVLDSFVGGALGVAATVWGVFDKTATEEMVTSALAKVITFAGGIAMTAGIVTQTTLTAILGIVPLLASEIIKRVNNNKDQRVITGKLALTDLKASTDVENKKQAVAPIVNATPK